MEEIKKPKRCLQTRNFNIFFFSQKRFSFFPFMRKLLSNETRKKGLSFTTKGSHLTSIMSFLSTQEFSQCFVIRKTLKNHVRSVTSDRVSFNSHKCGNSIKQEGMFFNVFSLGKLLQNVFHIECDNMKIVDRRAVLLFTLTDVCRTYKLPLIRGKIFQRREK